MERHSFFVEEDPLSGDDPYSASKACSKSSLPLIGGHFGGSGIGLATGGHGETSLAVVIEAQDRLIPDFLRALDKAPARRVTGCCSAMATCSGTAAGYLLVAGVPQRRAVVWRLEFRPLLRRYEACLMDCGFSQRRYQMQGWEVRAAEQPHEANLLKLDSSKARSMLNWKSRWSIQDALPRPSKWHQAWRAGCLRDISLRQIGEYPVLMSKFVSRPGFEV